MLAQNAEDASNVKIKYCKDSGCQKQWRTQKIFMGGGFFQWHMVIICIWCALFMTSQF